jgi:anti-anti-sigma regulatory factor
MEMAEANTLEVTLVPMDSSSVLLRCSGSIVFGPEADIFRDRLHRALEKARRCDIDLSAVHRADVRLAGILADAVTRARRNHCSLRITGVSDHVTDLLKVVGLWSILPITAREARRGTAA